MSAPARGWTGSRTATTAGAVRTASTCRVIATWAPTGASTCAASVTRAARRGSNGKGPEDLGAERVESAARLQERLRHRRLLHDVRGVPEPLPDLHGAHGPRGEPRRR